MLASLLRSHYSLPSFKQAAKLGGGWNRRLSRGENEAWGKESEPKPSTRDKRCTRRRTLIGPSPNFLLVSPLPSSIKLNIAIDHYRTRPVASQRGPRRLRPAGVDMTSPL